MKCFLTSLALCLFSLGATAQITWADDVAEIVYANCTACHRAEGIGPFSLIDYTDDVQGNENAILEAVGTGYMPPWTAEIGYQDYTHERFLSPDEIATIVEWVNTGSEAGNLADTPPPPVYTDEGFISATPDLVVQMDEYVSAASASNDDYSCFSIPTGLLADKKIKAYEIVPGNSEIVHHAVISIDANGTYPTNTSGFCTGPVSGLLGIYVPGAQPSVFPSDGADFNLGRTLPAGSNIVFAMHYPHGSAGMTDATEIRFFFYDDATPIREVQNDPVVENWDIYLPANSTTEVEDSYTTSADLSILSVFPHMHFLGDFIESYAITPDNVTIPIVRIPHWSFEWQEYYTFQNMLHIPPGTTIFGRGIYDNTANNPHNPNDPPIDVWDGLNSSDEMFQIYYAYLNYEEGDELIDIEALTQLPTGLNDVSFDNGIGVSTFPNPFEDALYFDISLEKSSRVSLYIYDQLGQLVDIVTDKQDFGQGEHRITWNPNEEVNDGVYYFSFNIDGSFGNGKVMRK